MTTEDTSSVWFPLFEFQEWSYQSTLILPTAEGVASKPGTTMTAKKWAQGTLVVGQAFAAPNAGYTLDGVLSFAQGITLAVSARGSRRAGNVPATFEATGTGTEGVTKGAIYELLGWAFPEEPIANNAARVLSIRGAVRAVRGPDTSPGIELGKMPVGTVGSFVVARVG